MASAAVVASGGSSMDVDGGLDAPQQQQQAATTSTTTSRLVDACRCGDVEAVRTLLANGGVVNAPCPVVLPYTARTTDNPNQETTNTMYCVCAFGGQSKVPPLHIAIAGGFDGLVSMLLEEGAAVNAKPTEVPSSRSFLHCSPHSLAM